MGNLDVGNTIVYDKKLSSVVPAQVTGQNMAHQLTNMDLVMKLHYLKGLYYFDKDAVQGLGIHDLKEPMFPLLDIYFTTSGRIRKSESGRPFIKCNDSGVRIIEAKCDMMLQEFLDNKHVCNENHLLHNHVLGPDLAFSPLIFLQFTWFKCGGMSIGLSWAHVLGDGFSASSFINMWAHIMAGNLPPKSLTQGKAHTRTGQTESPPLIAKEPLSVKRVDLIKDSWKAAGNICRMETFSFQITATQLNNLQAKLSNQRQTGQVSAFEAVCAVIWHRLAKIRGGGEEEPRTVTTCRNDIHTREDGILGNKHILSVVKADFVVAEASPGELAALIAKQSLDETKLIEDAVEGGEGLSDFIVYGANLTFVDLQDVNLYGFELKGEKPVFANYTIDGVGDQGVAIVLPGPENTKTCGGGRTVTVILPENEVMELREELQKDWEIV